MATLEVHDGQGRVQFVELTRDHPVLFGTSATCDVILEGAEIRPVHGRIRWKHKRFKVEASPDAEYVLVNGHKMTSSTIHQGDEVSVGHCRLFLLKADEQEDAGQRRGRRGEEGRTHVVAAPVVPLDPKTDSPRHGRPPAAWTIAHRRANCSWSATIGSIRCGRRHRSTSEDRQSTTRARRTCSADRPRGRQAFLWSQRPNPSPNRGQNSLFLPRCGATGSACGLFQRATRLVASESFLRRSSWVWSSPFLCLSRWDSGSGRSSPPRWRPRRTGRRIEDFNNGDYRNAIRKFDAFLKANPTDERANTARVMRAFADVRQYISLDGSTWSSALEASRAMVEQVGELPEFRDEQVNLADLLIRIGEGLADRARHSADPKSLAEAESVVPLHAQVAKESAPAFLNRSRLPSKLIEARAAVRKAQTFAHALEAMDKGLKDGSAARVYQARDGLVDEYADLARDRELIKRMTSANDLVRKAVTVDLTHRPAATTPWPDPLGPPTSVVFRSREDGPAQPPAPDAIVYALADGLAYAVDGTSGAPLWQVFLGLASPFLPVAIRGETTTVACDARSNELVQLDAQTGALKWRLALGEPVTDPPLVLGNQLVQVLPSGKLLFISLRTGDLEATVNLGRPLGRTPVSDESGQHLYVLGRQDCLFVLSRDPLACVAVEYLGHADGSIPCAPARLARFLLIPENDTLAESRWHILVLDQDGAKLRPCRRFPSPAGPGRPRPRSARSCGRPATRAAIRHSRWVTTRIRNHSGRSHDWRRTRHRPVRPSRWRDRNESSGLRPDTPGSSRSTRNTSQSPPSSPSCSQGRQSSRSRPPATSSSRRFETGRPAVWQWWDSTRRPGHLPGGRSSVPPGRHRLRSPATRPLCYP